MTNMPSETAGQPIAVVTGAAAGLGQVIASELHGAGYRVLLTDVDAAGAQAAAQALDASGTTAQGLALNVLNKADFEAALAHLKAGWGLPQVLVNNAALTLTTPVMQISPEEFSRVLDINLRGCFLGCQVFGAAMGEAGYGRIVNLASLAGQNGGTASGAHYASSKAGILTLTKIFARELGAKGVTVNAVAPGPMDLPSVHAAVPAERLAQIVKTIPVQRLGNPHFVARMVVLLASAEADFATGAAWDFNGGIFMR
ncbi:SDR family NAD(P)-dependent oxidoreductase [Ideonella benzenivorans]|uniref:SDR family NAD(P)-dependent oxidoreductase n=1 Tax=Ideonella benzenivorans TaxID=2831643 RepID=UPI001CED6BDB|nr:SDR family oxidoreductase [Ideonella benzenivorans]